MATFCIDIGNTHTHYGIVSPEGALSQAALPTRDIDHPLDGIAPAFWRHVARHGSVAGIAFCSVVPAATPLLQRTLELQNIQLPLFQLTHERQLGVAVRYPKPAEIGQDRLANAVGAKAHFGAPAIVIDLGTAVTFDVVTASLGYEGGVIAPGIEIMRSYLHEKTAQLPRLGERFDYTGVIGRSTIEAMTVGTVLGFAGMIQALLDALLAELTARGESPVHVLATGGAAEHILSRLRPLPVAVPDLTLRGLAAAFALNHS